MSRSGYSDACDCYGWELIMYRGAVASAMRGRRGQKFFRDLVDALDAMPEKRLIAEELVRNGEVCALGALGLARGLQMDDVNPENAWKVARMFDIAEALAREVVYENDEGGWERETGEQRWQRVRDWAVRNIRDKEAGS